MLTKTFSLKVTQLVIFSINTYGQDMISGGNENKKKLKTKTNGIIVIICLCYHCWGQIIVYSYFIWLNVLFVLIKQKKRINEFTIGYMINPGLNVNKSFR